MAELVCCDWRDLPEPLVAPLYKAEAARWSRKLGWDTASIWAEVERGRRLRTVRGFAVLREGRVVGWTYYIIIDRSLQIGGIAAVSEPCTQTLLRAVMSDPDTADVDVRTLFAFSDAPGLVQEARLHQMKVSRYWYLSRDLPAGVMAVPPPGARRWQTEDAAATADLLMRAYGKHDGSRPFAPRGERGEWMQYVQQITAASGCGTLLPDACFCVSAGPGRLAAVALASRIGDAAAHLVQLAVDPAFQRRGLGSALVEAVCGAARRQGYQRMTLLVAGPDRAARALYERADFTATASFISAGRVDAGQPRRLTSVAPGACVATLR